MPSIAEYKKQIQLRNQIKTGGISVLSQLGLSPDEKISKAIDRAISDSINEILNSIVDKLLGSDLLLSTIIEHVLQNVKIPDPVPGKDGNDGTDYVLTEEDKKNIAKKIKVPIVEKVIEKREIVKEKPIVTEIIQKIENETTGKEIVEKVNALPIEPSFQIDVSHIKGLEAESDKRKGTKLSGIARGGLKLIWNTVLDGTVNGVNTVFTIPTSLPSPVDNKYLVSARGVMKDVDGGDFTISNNNRTVTFTSAPPNGSMQPRIILYQAH